MRPPGFEPGTSGLEGQRPTTRLRPHVLLSVPTSLSFMSKRYASEVERELLRRIESSGGICFRVAGSGSYGGKPDLIARIGNKYYVIEVKYTKNNFVYIKEEQKLKLIEQALKFNAIPVLAVKFRKKGWRFFDLRLVENKIEINTKKGLIDIFHKSLI